MARLLVVEDDDDIREVLGMQLRRRGHEVTEARDGQDALARLVDTALPDVILLDLMMPRIDGWQLCQRLDASPAHAAIPRIVMTAFGNAARSPAAAKVLLKPFETEQLDEALDAVLGRSSIG